MGLRYHLLQLQIGGIYHFSRPLGSGETVTFKSTSIDLNPTTTGLHTIDNSAVNLLNPDLESLLHISIRRTENEIVFNSNINIDQWGREERIPLAGLFHRGGPTASISVLDLGEAYKITFDHHSERSYIYNKRSSDKCIAVSYTLNEGVAPVFSDPIYLEGPGGI